LCAYFGYSRSGYYKSLEVKAAVMFREEMVIKLVQDVRRYQPRIGGKKLYWLLKEDLDKLGDIGRDKFFDVLRNAGLLVKKKKKYVKTTDSYHRFHKYKNKLRRRLLTGPNQAIVSDITYLRTRRDGFVYLFLQTDAYSRKITGWNVSESLGIEGAVKALKMSRKQCPGSKGMIHHSDRGIQYCCKKYVALMKKYEMEISMTEENHCYENAIAERVNGILKQEFLLDEKFENKTRAIKAVREAIESYNNRRPHWSLNLCTPQQIHQAA
jgi:putative transposase